jgi:protein-tyrosine-phosphatase
MAVGLLKKILQSKHEDRTDWAIQSTGIWAEDGHPPAQNTLAVLRERGIDLGESLSHHLNQDMLDNSNLILTMERGHKEALITAFPEHASRIYMLSEMIGSNFDIVDPVGRSLLDYEHTAQEIERILSLGYKRIRKLAGG